MNSNTDYVSRYEHSTHIDSNLSTNQYFGWDGLLHPKAFKAIYRDNGSFNSSAVSVELSGQNLTLDELSTYVIVVSKCISFYE